VIRLRLERLRWHARNARASFCALVNERDVTPGAAGAKLPTPENVALGAGPNTVGCGDGLRLHESPVVHGGGVAGGTGRHGELALHTRASYRSSDLSKSCANNFDCVKKNASSPFSLASMNTDSSAEPPEETKPTHPPAVSLKRSFAGVQSPTPSGSYS
jgi:hypothetical protein